MKSLIHKSLIRFIGYSAVILLLSTPLFFFAMKYFYVEDIDDLLRFKSLDFQEDRLPVFEKSDIRLWNEYNEELQIFPDTMRQPKNRIVEQSFYSPTERKAIDCRTLYTPVVIEGESFVLFARINLIETHDLFGTLIVFYLLLLTILLISLTLVSRLVSKRLWRPFHHTLHQLELFALEGEHLPKFTETNVREFRELNSALVHLIDRNLKTYKIQKEFTQNASHELQTPLAVFQTKLDLLLQEPNLTEAQADIVQSLYEVTLRLSRLNKNLLLLAKMENRQFNDLQQYAMGEFVLATLSFFEEQIKADELVLTTMMEQTLIVTANKPLLDSLLSNLLANAIRHNRKGGEIFVEVKADALVVRNTGMDTPLDESLLFSRFYRTSQSDKGNGLGLSIVYQICLYHGWTVKYSFESGYHQFIIQNFF
ncbi:MAG: HAMP domain-containing sensor histidine kinase [Odoribacter sp.]